MYKNWEDKLIHNKRMAFTQNEKKPTDDNANHLLSVIDLRLLCYCSPLKN